MKIIVHEIMGAANPLEESRKRLLEAKRKMYEKIRARLAKERPVGGVCPRTQRSKLYEHGNADRNRH